MSNSAPKDLISATVACTLSASSAAVLIVRPVAAFTSLAMALHLFSLREASMISENASGCIAHLWTTTLPTPPAPIIRTFLLIGYLNFCHHLREGKEKRIHS